MAANELNFNHKINKPETPITPAAIIASEVVIRPVGNGRSFVLSIIPSISFSITSLKALAEQVINKPDNTNKKKTPKLNWVYSAPNKYPNKPDNTTVTLNLNLVKSAYSLSLNKIRLDSFNVCVCATYSFY